MSRTLVGLSIVVVGVLTAYGQGWFGDATASLANSAGPWSLTAFLVARTCPRWPAAIVCAVSTLSCCELGYALATEVRGGSNAASTVTFWLVAALLAGPPLGVAGTWSSGAGMRRGVGFAVIGGVLVGEGVYGWTTIADTTDWRYWAVEVAVGVIVVAVAVAASRRARVSLGTVAMAAATALVVFGAARLV